jgi:hypothetical protein
MRAIEATVRELLAAAHAAHKAKLDPGRVDTRFVVGDRVLLRTKELLDAADTDLRPRWVGPFTVVACPGPNAYTLALPRNMRCSPTVNVERLKPFFERVDALPPPGPVLDAGQEGEHEVELFLNRRLVRGVTQYLVRWRGHASPADAWLRVEELDHCRELMVEYDAIAPTRRAARRSPTILNRYDGSGPKLHAITRFEQLSKELHQLLEPVDHCLQGHRTKPRAHRI